MLVVLDNIYSYALLKNHPHVKKLKYEYIDKGDKSELRIYIPKHCEINEDVLEYNVEEIKFNFAKLSDELMKLNEGFKQRYRLRRKGRGGQKQNVKFYRVRLRKLITIVDKLNKGSKIIIEEFSDFIVDAEEERKIKLQFDKAYRGVPTDTSVFIIRRSIKALLYDVDKI